MIFCQIIRIIPVTCRIIKTNLQTGFVRGLDILLYNIFSIWCVFDCITVVIREEIRKSSMMLGSQHNIFHAGIFCQLHPFVRIIVYRIEFLIQGIVLFVYRVIRTASDIIRPERLTVPADLYTRYTGHIPVKEHPELRISEPFHLFLRSPQRIKHIAGLIDQIPVLYRLKNILCIADHDQPLPQMLHLEIFQLALVLISAPVFLSQVSYSGFQVIINFSIRLDCVYIRHVFFQIRRKEALRSIYGFILYNRFRPFVPFFLYIILIEDFRAIQISGINRKIHCIFQALRKFILDGPHIRHIVVVIVKIIMNLTILLFRHNRSDHPALRCCPGLTS